MHGGMRNICIENKFVKDAINTISLIQEHNIYKFHVAFIDTHYCVFIVSYMKILKRS